VRRRNRMRRRTALAKVQNRLLYHTCVTYRSHFNMVEHGKSAHNLTRVSASADSIFLSQRYSISTICDVTLHHNHPNSCAGCNCCRNHRPEPWSDVTPLWLATWLDRFNCSALSGGVMSMMLWPSGLGGVLRDFCRRFLA